MEQDILQELESFNRRDTPQQLAEALERLRNRYEDVQLRRQQGVVDGVDDGSEDNDEGVDPSNPYTDPFHVWALLNVDPDHLSAACGFMYAEDVDVLEALSSNSNSTSNSTSNATTSAPHDRPNPAALAKKLRQPLSVLCFLLDPDILASATALAAIRNLRRIVHPEIADAAYLARLYHTQRARHKPYRKSRAPKPLAHFRAAVVHLEGELQQEIYPATAGTRRRRCKDEDAGNKNRTAASRPRTRTRTRSRSRGISPGNGEMDDVVAAEAGHAEADQADVDKESKTNSSVGDSAKRADQQQAQQKEDGEEEDAQGRRQGTRDSTGSDSASEGPDMPEIGRGRAAAAATTTSSMLLGYDGQDHSDHSDLFSGDFDDQAEPSFMNDDDDHQNAAVSLVSLKEQTTMGIKAPRAATASPPPQSPPTRPSFSFRSSFSSPSSPPTEPSLPFTVNNGPRRSAKRKLNHRNAAPHEDVGSQQQQEHHDTRAAPIINTRMAMLSRLQDEKHGWLASSDISAGLSLLLHDADAVGEDNKKKTGQRQGHQQQQHRDFYAFDPGFPDIPGESQPARIQRPERLPRHLLFFINHQGTHWTLEHLDRKTAILRHYNSMSIAAGAGGPGISRPSKQFLRSSDIIQNCISRSDPSLLYHNSATRRPKLSCQMQLCPQQSDSHNCGIFVLAFAIGLMTNATVPSSIDPVSVRNKLIGLVRSAQPAANDTAAAAADAGAAARTQADVEDAEDAEDFADPTSSGKRRRLSDNGQLQDTVGKALPTTNPAGLFSPPQRPPQQQEATKASRTASIVAQQRLSVPHLLPALPSPARTTSHCPSIATTAFVPVREAAETAETHMTDSSNSGVGSTTTDPVDDIQPTQAKEGQESQAPAHARSQGDGHGHGHDQRHGRISNPCHSWITTLATRFQGQATGGWAADLINTISHDLPVAAADVRCDEALLRKRKALLQRKQKELVIKAVALLPSSAGGTDQGRAQPAATRSRALAELQEAQDAEAECRGKLKDAQARWDGLAQRSREVPSLQQELQQQQQQQQQAQFPFGQNIDQSPPPPHPAAANFSRRADCLILAVGRIEAELAAVKREAGECQTAISAARDAQLAAQDRVEQMTQLVEDFASVDADLSAVEGELGEVELILDGLSTMGSWV